MGLFTQDVIATINGNGYTQFGKEILITQMPFFLLEAIFQVDPEVQRKLDPGRRSEIRDFILKSVEKDDFYFSPFIFSARGGIQKSGDSWILTPGCKLYILDGQHRSAGIASAISHLKSKKESFEETNMPELADIYQTYLDKIRSYPVSMQIYLNLSQQEERQLFTDINTERRDAHVGIIMQYDHRDVYTKLARNLAQKLTQNFEVEQNLSRISIQSSALTSLTIIRKCLLAMFEGELRNTQIEPSGRYIDIELMETAAEPFFEIWTKIFPKQPSDRYKYVSGWSGIQIALAFAVFHLVKRHHLSYNEAIQQLLILKKRSTWKHNDPLFTHIYDPTSKKIKNHSSTTSIANSANKFYSIIEKDGMLI